MNPAQIPTTHYMQAKVLNKQYGMSYSELKSASQVGGVLKRWRSPKTKLVYYRSKNLTLF